MRPSGRTTVPYAELLNRAPSFPHSLSQLAHPDSIIADARLPYYRGVAKGSLVEPYRGVSGRAVAVP
jgi:hypothetical protein